MVKPGLIRSWDFEAAAAMVASVSTGAPVSKPEMKLLVVAQTPPPAHGQSLAVAALLEHLRADPGFELHHVPLALSRSTADIGRWRPGKLVGATRAGIQARRLLARHGPMPLYYVPAPGKRGALYRDWTVLGLARPAAAGLILHWHAVGLGAWLSEHASPAERATTHQLLGRATLSIVLAESCRADAEVLRPARCVVVHNGVPDAAPDFAPKRAFSTPCEVLFVGLGCHEKGLFDALEGVRLANVAAPGAFRLTVAGAFASAADEESFGRRAAPLGPAVRLAGFVGAAERDRLFRAADVLCFPTYYPHEGEPTVILEALSHDLPIVTTRWRAIPEVLPSQHVYYVAPRAPAEIAAALRAARAAGPAGGTLRAAYLARFTREQHLAAMSAALRAADKP